MICLSWQVENLLAAKADAEVLEEQRESLETILQANSSSLGSQLDAKADSLQVCHRTRALQCACASCNQSLLIADTCKSADRSGRPSL